MKVILSLTLLLSMIACRPNARRKHTIRRPDDDSIQATYVYCSSYYDGNYTVKQVKAKLRKRKTYPGLSGWTYPRFQEGSAFYYFITDSTKLPDKMNIGKESFLKPTATKKVIINNDTFLLYKYIIDEPGSIDEEGAVVITESYGIVYAHSLAWRSYSRLIRFGNEENDIRIAALYDAMLQDKEFMNKNNLPLETIKFVPPPLPRRE